MTTVNKPMTYLRWPFVFPKRFLLMLIAGSIALFFFDSRLIKDKFIKHILTDPDHNTTAIYRQYINTTYRIPITEASSPRIHGESTSKDENENNTEPLACIFPNVNPYDPEIMKLSELDQKPLICRKYLPDLTYISGNKIKINKNNVTSLFGNINVTCRYQDIFKDLDDDTIAKFGNWSNYFNNSIKLPDTTEFIRVFCFNESMRVISKTYYALVPKHDRKLKIDHILLKKHQKESSPKEILNVMIVGFDGVSRHHFLRAMNKTYSFLMNDLQSFDFTMHTQVGINTFPNMLPLLTGKSESEVYKWWKDSYYSDAFDLIWRDYEKAGYQTLFTEDWPAIGGFHFAKRGFLFPPTRYYSHPLNVATDADHDLHLSANDCLGSKPELFFHMDYIKRFYDTFPNWPKFAMTFLTRMTHDILNDLKKVDDHTYDIYSKLYKEGYLNRTVLITLSDHGQRWGLIRSTFNGMIESRTPYTILTFPKWFLEKYPDVVRNLKTNTARLTTHYDTHATLQELLYFKAKGHVPLKTGHRISLFQVIPKNRTCNDSHIPPEFCVCGQDSEVAYVKESSELSKLLAREVVASVNSKMNKSLCAELNLDKILQVVHVHLNIAPTILKGDVNDRTLFKVKLQTTPGLAIYEATVYCKGNFTIPLKDTGNVTKENSNIEKNVDTQASSNRTDLLPLHLEVGESIERFTMYRGQADCVDVAKMKPFCYCKNLLHNSS